jgi:hypothetical protein
VSEASDAAEGRAGAKEEREGAAAHWVCILDAIDGVSAHCCWMRAV